MAVVSAKRVTARAQKDPKFKAKALKNPGLRSKLPDSMVGKKVAAKRALNRRLDAPAAPGSSMTNRDVAHQATADTNVAFGPRDRDAQYSVDLAEQRKRDVNGWYDQYLAQLAQGTQNVAGIQQAADARLQALGQGVTGISTGDLNQLQGQANADAAKQGVASAGNLAPIAEAAAQSRQNLVGSFQAQQAVAGGAQNAYMNREAHVVAPTQRLSALGEQQGLISKARADQTALVGARADFNVKDRQDIVNREQQYGLASAGLNLKAEGAAADAAANTPSAKAAVTAANEEARQAAKHGLSISRWRALGATGRAKKIAADKHTSGADHRYTSGPFIGKRPSEVDQMSDGQLKAAQDAYDKKMGRGKGGKKSTKSQSTIDSEQFYKKYGVKPVGTPAINKAKSDINTARTYIKNALANPGKKRLTMGEIGQVLSVGSAAHTDDDGKKHAAIPKLNPILVRVAMDLAGPAHAISAATAKRLHEAGYTVSTLGLPTGVPTTRGGARNYPDRRSPGGGH